MEYRKDRGNTVGPKGTSVSITLQKYTRYSNVFGVDTLYKSMQGIAMFLVYNVHIDEHRNVQYTIEQYGENNKQRVGMYVQWHWASASPKKLYCKRQNIGGTKVWRMW